MWIVKEYGSMINTVHVRLISICETDDGDYFHINAFYANEGEGTMIMSSD